MTSHTHAARRQARELLEKAKKAVEIAIEESEQALAWLERKWTLS